MGTVLCKQARNTILFSEKYHWIRKDHLHHQGKSSANRGPLNKGAELKVVRYLQEKPKAKLLEEHIMEAWNRSRTLLEWSALALTGNFASLLILKVGSSSNNFQRVCQSADYLCSEDVSMTTGQGCWRFQ